MIDTAAIEILRTYEHHPDYRSILDEHREVYAGIHSTLESYATACAGDGLGYGLTSGFAPASGVRGYRPKDLWCALFNETNKAFMYMPQIFMIVSPRGVEYGFAAAIHRRDFSNQGLKRALRETVPILFKRHPSVDSPIIQELDGSLEETGGWHFRKKARLAPNADDFDSLHDLVEFIKSPEGQEWGAATIVRYVLPEELDSRAADLLSEFQQAVALFRPLMAACRMETIGGPSKPTSLAEVNVWAEKTLVAGRPDRNSGPHALGKALWSPQKNKADADYYRAMRDVQPDDIVIHLIDNKEIAGVSLAASRADDTFVGISGTPWSGQPAYRIELKDFVRVEPTLGRERFLRGSPFESELKEIYQAHDGKGLFYRHDLQLNQGAYLTKAPPELVAVLNRAYFELTGRFLPHLEAWDAPPKPPDPPEPEPDGDEPGPIDVGVLAKDLFMEEEDFVRILDLLKSRKNLILQGPPGVGKSFIAKRLAYGLLGAKDERRVEMVQFHQSYSYEDFVQGYRPTEAGGFELRDGLFLEFCECARKRPEAPFVFIIDEINRSNLSKVLGELMLLIERDKRGPAWSLPLAYRREGDKPFFVPENVYLLGMMNTADRSLAVVDYALRRRFVFVDLEPQFGSARFRQFLLDNRVESQLVDKLIARLTQLNGEIASDTTNLGPGFRIGHSFFCPDGQMEPDESWYETVVETEIAPLLREYFFEDSSLAVARVSQLLA